ncbi:MAG TPA: glucose-6-phosphate dehydrogenase [Niabella sp.]|nr:glucose-6-phosphate dehydrogenase [Niabella sp.]HQW14346.1 glucose-6-phosphate dehydrogenase [Niabella sp.]HQX18375.1 glucose-6-phosphate dehydrogenase [Niabella sp.]HQX40133.1 glucose-6-phosphate dehydrogenase [Niabella sp.]HRB05900.1 glucose-6-phosphate dehydrogenase [Niabella sp.]
MQKNNNGKKPQATILVIFGGSGDLNQRKLTPALFNLCIDGFMPEKFAIIGTGRTNYSNEDFREHLYKAVQEFSRRKENPAGSWESFSQNISYLRMDVDRQESYLPLKTIIEDFETEWEVRAHVIFYLAVAPQLVPEITTNLHKLELEKCKDTLRFVIEKPFGHDLKSAKELNKLLTDMFDESQIYRIDHYLGKETVQNILAFRFANALFEPIWNRNYIDHVQITASETVGVEDRGGYYDRSGALRDMVQNHILQLICMVAMEAPVSFEADEIRNKKSDVLNALRKIKKEEVQRYAVRGQYSAGWMKAANVKGYREEKGVTSDSSTETFAAVKFYIDNWRWQGVPFYVRTGKFLKDKTTLITIQFKEAPKYAFPPETTETWRSNRLTISIQPEMDIRLRFQAKRPGQTMSLNPVNMVFNYADTYHQPQPESYETLLLDAMMGNATQYMRGDQVEIAWKVIEPILNAWENRPPVDFPNYSPGSWGPEDAEALIAKDGRNWIALPPPTSHESK